MTVFKHEALFNGTDTASHLGLWVTNGTAAETHELNGVTAASMTGLDPTDMSVFNNEVLFNGVDANGLSGLWATDGTAGGTHELLAGGSGSNPVGLNPTDLTVYNGKVLFSGLDASGDMGLWGSDGTAAGTLELTGIAGADSSGLAPSDLTVFNGEVLFRGFDQSGRPQLWVTNGTVAGTHELTGIVGAGTTAGGFNPSGFTVYDSMVLFSGDDLSGHDELWTTNGTAAGTMEINPGSAAQSLGLSPVDLTALSQSGPNPPTPPQVTNPTQPQATHPFSEHRRAGLDLGCERGHLDGGGPVTPIPGRVGKRSEPAISMAKAIRTSCGRTRTPAKPRSGR